MCEALGSISIPQKIFFIKILGVLISNTTEKKKDRKEEKRRRGKGRKTEVCIEHWPILYESLGLIPSTEKPIFKQKTRSGPQKAG